MDTSSFIVYIKTEDIYSDNAKNFEIGFDISSCELNRRLPKGKNKNVIDLIKQEFAGKIMKEFAAIRVKKYSYLIDNNNEDKKVKVTKM